MNFFNRLFGSKQEKSDEPVWTDEEAEQFDLAKDEALQKALGKSAGEVGHAIIPFEVGGALDMYYYPNHISGTGFATQELLKPDGTGPIPNQLGTYELLAFTKLAYDSSTAIGEGAFGQIERRICSSLTWIARYAFDAKLEPGETCRLPYDEEPHRFFIFDQYKNTKAQFNILGEEYGLLLIMEIHEEEMNYAVKNGSQALLPILKSKEYYPYSDLDRPSVV